MDNGQLKPEKTTRRQPACGPTLEPFYQDEWISVYVGDVRDVLPKLLASLAAKDRPQMCISSPPYLGLRDYGTADWDISATENTEIAEKCDHKPDEAWTKDQGNVRPAALAANNAKSVGRQKQRNRQFANGRGESGKSLTSWTHRDGTVENKADVCCLCGARRVDSQIGLEATPAEFTAAMVTVFDDCRSVLKDDGTLWLNLGDSYAGSWGNYVAPGSESAKALDKRRKDRYGTFKPASADRKTKDGIKPKDLMLMPFEVARALRDAGWWLRQAFPWTKRSAMPGSQEDRATTALEWIFQLAKKKHYFYDSEAIRMGSITNDPRRPYGSKGMWQMDGRPESQQHGGTIRKSCQPDNWKGSSFSKGKTAGHQLDRAQSETSRNAGRDRSNGNRNGEGGYLDETPSGSRGFRNTDLFYTQVDAPHGLIFAGDEIVGIDCNPAGFSGEYCTACKRYYHDARDKREIEVKSQKSKIDSEEKQIRVCICGRSDAWLSHFATFPMKLVTPFIRCGTSEAGECGKCGKAWVRVTETTKAPRWQTNSSYAQKSSTTSHGQLSGERWDVPDRTVTLGFEPQCECDAPARPQTVLDPFGGAGTTMIVAAKLGRRCISIELNEEYAAMSIERYKREMRRPVDPPRREEAMPLFSEQ